ncbi:MAG: hypothetical protein H5U36_02040 [Candidatus Caldatribacterium sp.]|nr:hypothetical protein [Candidatus Caldatribacterium sp.]
MRKFLLLFGTICVAVLLTLLSLRENSLHPEVRFFLFRALVVRNLPDPAQGILTTHPPLPLLLALALRGYFPLAVGLSATLLLLAGVRRENTLPVFLVLLSPVFLLGTIRRPALTLFSLFAALGFSAILASVDRNDPEKLLLGNIAFGFTACLHPFGTWILPLFTLCEVLLPRVSLPRRGTLAALALFPFLALQGMALFFGWVYEGYALSPFRDPELSLGVFLSGIETPSLVGDLIPLLPFLALSLFSGLSRTLLFSGITLFSLLARSLVSPFSALLPALLFALDPKPWRGLVLGAVAHLAVSWALYFAGILLC